MVIADKDNFPLAIGRKGQNARLASRLTKYKIDIMVKLIELHSSKIKIQDINKENKDFYKRLLKIQKCDAMGYEKEHAMQICQQLENTEAKLKKL